MRLCGFLGHDCLLWKRSPFDKNTEAESPDNHCRVLLWDGPADTPIMFQTPCTNVCSCRHGTFARGARF
jgi:hypothetical protein